MGVLHDHQQRALMRQRFHLSDQRVDRFLPAQRRGQCERGIASVVGQRQHFRDERGVLERGRGDRQRGIELVELGLHAVFARQTGRALDPRDDRIKCAVGVLRGAEIAQAPYRARRRVVQERRREPGFADTGLAGNQHHLALLALRLRPAPQQQFGFFFASDQRGQVGRVQRLEAAFDRACPQRRPGPHRAGNALELGGAEILQIEQIAEQLARAFRDDHHVRLGGVLQPRRQIRRLDQSAGRRTPGSNSMVASIDFDDARESTHIQGDGYSRQNTGEPMAVQPERSGHIQSLPSKLQSSGGLKRQVRGSFATAPRREPIVRPPTPPG